MIDAIRQHADWISKQPVEKLRDEDLMFAKEWFEYHQKFSLELKRRTIIRKFIEFVTTNGFDYVQLDKLERLLPKLFDEMMEEEPKKKEENIFLKAAEEIGEINVPY